MAGILNYLYENYMEIPMITRTYITACYLTTLSVQLDIISPFQLYFNYKLIFYHYQFWRLFTSFLYFGSFGFTFMFNLIFIFRYCRMLEQGTFRSKPADFLCMLLFGAFLMILLAPFVNLLFLGNAFTIMLVYLWSRRNPTILINFLGLFSFRAFMLPWILLGLSLLLGNTALVDLLGITVGHVYYYLEDVFPTLPGGFKVLKTPKILVYLLNPVENNHMEYVDDQNEQNQNIENNQDSINDLGNDNRQNNN